MKKKRKTEKSQRQKAIAKLDNVFSKFIRLRDCNSQGIVVCPLCGTHKHRTNAQNMHFIKRGVLKYRFDEKNCHAGCMHCNVMLNGNYIEYTRRMQRHYGIEKVDSMIYDKKTYTIHTPELIEKIEYYQAKVEELRKEKNL